MAESDSYCGGPSVEGRAYDDEIVGTRDTLHRALTGLASRGPNPTLVPTPAAVADMLDRATLKYIRDAGQVP